MTEPTVGEEAHVLRALEHLSRQHRRRQHKQCVLVGAATVDQFGDCAQETFEHRRAVVEAVDARGDEKVTLGQWLPKCPCAAWFHHRQVPHG